MRNEDEVPMAVTGRNNHETPVAPEIEGASQLSEASENAERWQLLPPLTDDEFAALKRDIAEHGVLSRSSSTPAPAL